ncbi:protein kinase [Streptomyces sp. NPDC101206]|uniref:serine/threonine-protein kinase n=1 Tax=Streptomyces sp. NPDC101206 TaxID=3366128 RepID=UPI0038112772
MYDEETAPEQPAGGRLVAGRYRLLSRLGEGGMGTVWCARDEVLQRDVAVKEVRAPAGLRTGDVTRLYSRLEREAWAAARIADRNVVTIHDVVMDGDRPWIVMELIRGRSLADVLRTEGALTPQHAAHIGAEVLTALRAAHAVGVEHRDVKPANVLISDDGRVVLSDFGIAVVEGSTALTMAGEVIGSPEYLPPERALGGTSGPESDLWSLGVLLYATVEGVSPFRQDTALSTLRSVVESDPPSPRRAGPLAPVIEGLLRKEPAERTPARSVAEALRTIVQGGAAWSADSAAERDPQPGTAPEPEPGPEPETVDAPVVTPLEATAAGAPVATPAASHAASPVTSPGAPRRRRRGRAALVAGGAAVLLVGSALGYVLVQGEAGAGASAGQVPVGASSPDASAVRVAVSGSNTAYAGACAPPADRAPTFTATFTASQPARISYRWVSEDGSVVDPHWRVMTLGGTAAATGQDTVRLTTYSKSGTLDSRIGVEIRDPVRTASNQVPFSVTCRN